MKQCELQFSAIILAAGYSSRMNGSLKALLPLGMSNNMLCMAIKSFQEANISDIYVVVGHEHAQIINAVKKFAVQFVYNGKYESGMFSSICAGIRFVQANNKICTDEKSEVSNNAPHARIGSAIVNNASCATFILPVDAPLVKSSTIKALAAQWSKSLNQKLILTPIFMQNCGHPPLISNIHFEGILNYETQGELGGLKGFFASLLEQDKAASFLQGVIPVKNNSKYVDFSSIVDEGIISDIDTIQDYEKAQKFLQITCNREHASIAESCYILQKAELAERIVKHSYAVALGALRLGLALENSKSIKLEYHICGAILHDIFRTEKDHALKCKIFLWELGWKDLGYIVGAHSVLPKKILTSMQIHLHEENIESKPSFEDLQRENNFKLSPECLNASICVYLSDKFFSSDQFVSIEERFSRVKQKFANDNPALEAIKERELVAMAVNDWFFNETKIRADECVQTESTHVFEKQLKDLLKI